MKKYLRRFLQRSHRFPWIRFRGNRYLTVRMDTTNKCNLRCSMCPMRLSDEDPDREWKNIDPELFRKIADDLFPLAEVVSLSCGAEPLMNPEFGKYLETLYKADVPVREVVTNAVLLNDENIKMFLDAPPTSLFVSIDGAEAETHAGIRSGADLGHIIFMLEKLIKARDKRGKKFPMVSFSVTLQKANYTELQDIIRLAAGIGAESVSTVPLVAYKGLGMSDEVVDMSSGEIRDTLKLSADTADNLGVGFTVPDAGSNGESNSCKYLDSWIFVDPDGKVFPCPYWNTSQPVGDFTLNTFEQIWSGTAYNTLREHISKGILKGICSICPENRDSENIEILKT